MSLQSLRHRILTTTRRGLGRGAVTLCAFALLASSLPNVHWHVHSNGEAPHEHSVLDGPDAHEIAPHTETHHAHHPADVDDDRHADRPVDHGGELPGDHPPRDSGSLHHHDGNHSMSAVGIAALRIPGGAWLTSELPVPAAIAEPHAVFHPPYRPPIA